MTYLNRYAKLIAIASGIITFVLFRSVTAAYDIGWFLAAVLGYGVYFSVEKVLSAEPEVKKLKKPPTLKVGILTDEHELKSMMNDAYEDLIQIQKCYRKAKHESIRINGEKLFHTGVAIFEHLRKNPSKIRQARRYLTYYLDTAAGIMNKYIGFVETRLDTEEINKVYLETEKALEILNEAFNKQFVKLMQNDMMDIEADVKVLEDTLRTEE